MKKGSLCSLTKIKQTFALHSVNTNIKNSFKILYLSVNNLIR